ncbi:MAG: MYXO-CTERM sorting domain-containing protein [Deltaproteobacteria bacterium]|jgi:MYXO-CTERM domain-containing protein
MIRKLALALIGVAVASPAAAFQSSSPTVTTLGEGTARSAPRVAASPRDKAAWDRFVDAAGGRWRAIYDADTGAPPRIWGSGIPAPGSVADKTVAETFARSALRTHIDLLAPGARAEDFELSANVLSKDGVRSVGFVQNHEGLRVDGGQVSFSFKHDRLVVLRGEAWPNLAVPAAKQTLSSIAAANVAKQWVFDDIGEAGRIEHVSAPLVRAVVLEDGTVRAARVRRVIVRTTENIGRWEVDVTLDGDRFARRQTLMFAGANLQYAIPGRRPTELFPRVNHVAPLTDMTIAGTDVRTDADGAFTFTASTTEVVVRASGRHAFVLNDSGPEASATLPVEDGGTVIWDPRGDEEVDAQVITYMASQDARDYVKVIAPTMRFLDQPLEATVNIDNECNAFSDGMTINFFLSSERCENTGRLPDVVRHEYGHAVHANAVIPGVGAFDSALSEGASDFLAATIVNDPGMGRGFFRTDDPLRHIDPLNDEAVYPEDVGESHVTGLIFAGALWDLRKTMIEKHGMETAVRMVDDFWFATLQRSSGITNAYVEVVLADDDDGNLSNGTPNLCDITAAFELHGIALGYTPGPELGEMIVERGGILLPVSAGEALCPGAEYVRATVTHEIRGQPETYTEVDMARTPDGFGAVLPRSPEGEVLRYRIELELGSGRILQWPNNDADPMYEMFLGEVTELYCTDFENDPFADGWTAEMTQSDRQRNQLEWEWGIPREGWGSGDPLTAYSGTRVIGQDLGGDSDGRYERAKTEVMRAPPIPVTSPNIRLQYRRWLLVEDGDNDQAEIYANGEVVWSNLASGGDRVHHLDREWRFHDVDLSAAAASGEVNVEFSMRTDQFRSDTGGWTIDDVCIVAWDGPSVVCGDGEVGQGEACDDGNQLPLDGCELDCTISPAPICGNGAVEMNEACDDGNTVDGDGCEASCIVTPAIDPNANMLDEDGSGCGCSTTDRRGGAAVALLLVLGLVVRRRR